jgi:hypothetical protein
MAEDKVKAVPIYKLKQSRLHQGEAKLRWWSAEIEEGTPYEELFNPVYWDNHGYKFAPGDMIAAEPDEGHYTAWLKVIGTGTGGVRIAEFLKKTWGAAAKTPDAIVSQYRVKYAGPHHRWRVERIADSYVEQAGFENEVAANSWLADNLKALSKSTNKKAA